MEKKNKARKWHNHKVVIDGMRFDSEKEGDRFIFLRSAEQRGEISDLERQVRYEVIPSVTEDYVVHLKTKDKVRTRTVQRATYYYCDFRYRKGEELVVEDVKGSERTITPEFRLKQKLMLWRFGIHVRTVFSSGEKI